MIPDGFFVTPATRTRQAYRTEPLYRHTFTVLLAIALSVFLATGLTLAGKVTEGKQVEEQDRLATQEGDVKKEESRLQPTVEKIDALSALRKRIETRIPAAKVLALVEEAFQQSPDVCLRQVDVESNSDDKVVTDGDHWTVRVQAIARTPNPQVVAGFKDAITRGFSGGVVSFTEQPNQAQAEPQFTLQIQYPR